MLATMSAEEIHDLRQAVAAVCERHCPEDRVRDIAYSATEQTGGFDRDLWAILCEQVGVAAMAVPENHGGLGAGTLALGAVAEQLGRVLAPVPYVASAVLATGLLLDAAPAGLLDDWLPSLMDGSRTAAAVLGPGGGFWQPQAVTVVAEHDSPVLHGRARHVLHAHAADLLVVAARTDDSLGLFAVDRSDTAVSITAEQPLDGTRPTGTVEFDGVRAHRLNAAPSAADIIQRNVDRAVAALSAEQAGACARVLEIATEYACTRKQFGRPIGSFQAVKHACANVLVDLEWSRSASQAALESVDDYPGELGWRASMAKAVCSQALRDASHVNLQIHGGIGFTWENSAHLFLKRARTDEVIFGGPDEHWERLMTDWAEILAC